MSSPPNPSNILLNPIPELTESLRTNSFGIDPSSHIIQSESFPLTPDDLKSIKAETSKTGRTSERVRAKARIVLLEGEGLGVVLDQRGYTIEERDGEGVKGTWESLEALLIAISPGYVRAMGDELASRFEGYDDSADPQEDEDGSNRA